MAFCDGHVQFLRNTLDDNTCAAHLTVSTYEMLVNPNDIANAATGTPVLDESKYNAM